MQVTLHDNVFASLYLSSSAGATGGGVWKEPLTVFTNGGVACGIFANASNNKIKMINVYGMNTWSSLTKNKYI